MCELHNSPLKVTVQARSLQRVRWVRRSPAMGIIQALVHFYPAILILPTIFFNPTVLSYSTSLFSSTILPHFTSSQAILAQLVLKVGGGTCECHETRRSDRADSAVGLKAQMFGRWFRIGISVFCYLLIVDCPI